MFYFQALIDYSTVLLSSKELDIKVIYVGCNPLLKYYFFLVLQKNWKAFFNCWYTIQVLQNRGLLYLDLNDIENALKDFSQAAKVHFLKTIALLFLVNNCDFAFSLKNKYP